MKKSFSFIVVIAIITMLFSSCSPEPASTEDIAAATELIGLVTQAERMGLITQTPSQGEGLGYTISLTEEYTATNGDKLTTYEVNVSATGSLENMESLTARYTMTIAGTVGGKSYTIKGSASASYGDTNPAYSLTINGKTLDPDSIQLPG